MALIQNLEQLIDVIEQRNMSIRPYLRPGLLQSDIETALTSLGLEPPPELLALYQWHDGINIERTRDIVLIFGEETFLPLIDAVNAYHDLVESYSDVRSELDLSRCFPFAAHDAELLAVYCSEIPFDGLYHPIVHIFQDISIGFENLEAMVQTVIAWFVHGVYDSSPVNEALHKSIWQKLNPNIIPRDTTL